MGQPKDITETKLSEIRYSICTFVTRHSQYNDMVKSFVSHGFSYDDCEYLYIDNSETNRCEAYAGINKFLTYARGLYIIVCHQDLLLLEDDRKKLELGDRRARPARPELGRMRQRGRHSSGAPRASDHRPARRRSIHGPSSDKGPRPRREFPGRPARRQSGRVKRSSRISSIRRRSLHRGPFPRLYNLRRRFSPPPSELWG